VGDRVIGSGFTGGSIPALPLHLALLKGASLVGVDAARLGMVHEPAPGQVYPFPRFADALAAVAGQTAVGRVVVEAG